MRKIDRKAIVARQREQLVRRLAAKDRSIALMSLDPPFVAEFAEAGFLRAFTEAEAAGLTAGVLGGPVDGATWNGRLVAAPFWANSQLLWYRKEAAARAGVDPGRGPVTWEQIIAGAEQASVQVLVQGARYEGYTVWISALVASGGGQVQTAEELFGRVPRADPHAAWRYDTKPLVAVGWDEARQFALHISGPRAQYSLPTEAQWEKAARGGLVGARHAWGDEPPTPDNCDFGRFREFSIQPSRTFAPNGYGLYAMNGGVWEWTADDFRPYPGFVADPYAEYSQPWFGTHRVLRGGCWATSSLLIRNTWRNFYTPDRRDVWAGFRTCAR